MAKSLPSHDDMADMFLALGALQAPAELHGYVTGQLAVGLRLEGADWLAQVATVLDCERPDPEQGETLQALYRSTLAQLEEGQLDLELLLPDESFDLSQRAESLGLWCQGFLAGFAEAGKRRQAAEGQREYSSDVTEVLNDLVAIAQVGVEAEEDEDSESHFFAVCEYVRMAALSIFLECNTPPGAGQKPVVLPPAGGRLH